MEIHTAVPQEHTRSTGCPTRRTASTFERLRSCPPASSMCSASSSVLASILPGAERSSSAPGEACSPVSSPALASWSARSTQAADAVRLAEEDGLRDGLPVDHQVGDAERLPYGDGVFDVAYYQDTLETIDDLDRVLSEAARVLRAGGAFLYDTVNRTALSRRIYLGALQSWRWTRIMPRDRYTWERLRPPDDLAASMSKYGLRNHDVSALMPASPLRLIRAMLQARQWTASTTPNSPASPACTLCQASVPTSPTSVSPRHASRRCEHVVPNHYVAAAVRDAPNRIDPPSTMAAGVGRLCTGSGPLGLQQLVGPGHRGLLPARRNPVRCRRPLLAPRVHFGGIIMTKTDDAAIVQTTSGPVRGTVTDNYRRFQGIPYAASTAGEMRWRSPQPAPAWSELRDATKPGSICAQQPSSYADVASLDEDCLYLNVTTPRTRRNGLKPTMVWIHGDGAIGAGSFFDARPLATRGDVVVVTINYRLGIFGTFGHPGLDGSGTFGLQDQQAALRWVQRNVAAFGGDPDNVTLFGESYGALATTAHLTSPGSEGLFQRAIIQSGFGLMDLPAGAFTAGVPAVDWFGWQPSAEAEAAGTAAAAQLGCGETATPLECLRQIPVENIVALSRPLPFAYGNQVLPELPAKALRDGRFQRVPIMSGATRDEHRLFVGLFRALAGQPVSAEQYPTLLADAFGDHADQVRATYPLSGYESPSVAWATVLTDRMWARSTFEQHKLLAQHTPTYAYEFADRHAPMYLPFPKDLPPGAFHAAGGALPLQRPEVRRRRHTCPAAPVRPDDPLLGELRAHRRSQRRQSAELVAVRPHRTRATRTNPRPGSEWHRTRSTTPTNTSSPSGLAWRSNSTTSNLHLRTTQVGAPCNRGARTAAPCPPHFTACPMVAPAR